MKRPFTYKQIIQYVREYYGYTVQTCVIARVLREFGYEMREYKEHPRAAHPKLPTDRDRKAIKEAIDNIAK